jgi:hypothetical protein
MQRISNFLYILRKLVNISGFLFIGYLLGNAFPTFEVRRLTDSALPVATMEGCAPLCKDYDDRIVLED